ncbi:MAG: type II toxin-antitoxin system VapC family toxin [Actinomycetota bacterium]
MSCDPTPDVAWYIDTSAFLKLVVAEPESDPLRAWLASHDDIWSSELLRTESLRAASRLGVERRIVETALEVVALVLPGSATFAVAGKLGPEAMCSLDALHLATALEMGADLEGLVTYDHRMADGARELSLAVESPN